MRSLALLRAVALTSSLGMVSGGCSLSLSGVDAGRPRNAVPACDTEKHLVVVDGIIGSIAALTTLVALSDGEAGVGTVAGLTSAAFLLAASRGNSTVNECRQAIAAFEPMPDPERAREARQTLRGPLPPPAVQNPIAVEPAMPPVVVTPAPPTTAAPPPPSRPAPPAQPEDAWRDFWRETP